jgi:hypothetical protein
MNHLLRAASLPVLASLLAFPLAAQPVQPAAPAASAQPLPARPALEGYQPFDDGTPVPWRQANDTVGRIGGWKAYAREAQGEPAAPTSNATPAPAAPADPHAGHKH